MTLSARLFLAIILSVGFFSSQNAALCDPAPTCDPTTPSSTPESTPITVSPPTATQNSSPLGSSEVAGLTFVDAKTPPEVTGNVSVAPPSSGDLNDLDNFVTEQDAANASVDNQQPSTKNTSTIFSPSPGIPSDTNGDGKPDQWDETRPDGTTVVRNDLNGDGYIDKEVRTWPGGEKETLLVTDRDGDGKLDKFEHTFAAPTPEGEVKITEVGTDFDDEGKAKKIETTYSDGRSVVQEQVDINGDGKPDEKIVTATEKDGTTTVTTMTAKDGEDAIDTSPLLPTIEGPDAELAREREERNERELKEMGREKK